MPGNSSQIYSDAERLGLVVYLGAVVIPVAIVMNSLMIFAFIKYKKLRITGMYFIVNLAVCNLVATTVSAPLIICSIIQNNVDLRALNQGIACDLRAVIDASLLCISAVTLATSSVDRCLAVYRPFTYHKIITYRRAVVIIVLIWIVCTAVCLPPVFDWGDYKYSRYSFSCAISIKSTYPMVYFVFVLFIPVFVAVVSYSVIFSVAFKSIKQLEKTYKTVEAAHDMRRSRRAMKSALRTLALVGVFAITFLPTLVIGCLMWIQVHTRVGFTIALNIFLAKVLHWVTFSGYALNPIVYGLMDQNFRRAWKNFVKCDKYHDEFRIVAQKQLYSDLEEEKRRARGTISNGAPLTTYRNQSLPMTEICTSTNGTLSSRSGGNSSASSTCRKMSGASSLSCKSAVTPPPPNRRPGADVPDIRVHLAT